MFTGLIDHCGSIIKVDFHTSEQQLWITSAFTHLELGESIAIDGICLTVTAFHEDVFCCDISPETAEATTVKFFKPGQPVNLERALQIGSRLGGHFVTGHIDQTARLDRAQKVGEFVEMHFSGISKEAKKLLTKKGSIAINGVSLTLNELTETGFSVMLIPHTLQRTNLHLLNENDVVNIEFDMLAKILLQQSEHYLP